MSDMSYIDGIYREIDQLDQFSPLVDGAVHSGYPFAIATLGPLTRNVHRSKSVRGSGPPP